ncbi:MAG: S-methyl-5'-thioadenosine phosphorylase [Nitrospina sp.]|jgi:5'-methylthioadenosine phosphorylase|nr:S-methyl-5'-thioadenosine phosphorylase [Nitrospina sp.]MBT6716598.1 S-methyl-5'-thioadenosine phosphorylase [Nitrospina sp.]
MSEKIIGVIGGSGLYQMEGLDVTDKIAIDTPYGSPSDEIIIGTLRGKKLAFLPRHGVGHFIPPSEINFRANIFAMKKLGVQKIISVSAVGSMKEKYPPGHFVVPDQFIDRTHQRISTFFTKGMVGHVSLADPICGATADALFNAAEKAEAIVHKGGVYICIEGPQFSTRAESNVYRQWGVDVIGMTNVTEAKLAREAGLCYSTLALVTDFDCWHIEEEPVTLEAVLEIMHQNVERAQKVINELVPLMDKIDSCGCADAAKQAIVTDPKKIPEKLKEDLSILFG